VLSATPQISDAPALPTALAHIQAVRQRGLSLLSRHSNETTRMIRKKSTRQQSRGRSPRTSSRTRGNAAKVAPPAMTSPDFVAVPDRSDRLEHLAALALVLGRNGSSIPTPKSKPSSRK
jgi:hypothetical protein